MSRIVRLIPLGPALVLALGACSPASDTAAPGITVTDPRVPAPASGASTAAAYLTVSNAGANDDRLLAVECDAAAAAMLHETVRDGDMMRMVHRPEGYAIPAGATLVLEPGGKHIMLHGVEGMEADRVLRLRLRFERQGTIELDAPVVPGH